MDGCSDDSATCGSQSQVNFLGTAGTTYYFMAGGYNGLTGDLTFTLNEVPLVITQPPIGQTANAGDAVTLTVSATGSDLGYQWQLAGANVAGATNYYLVLTNLAPAMAGNYRVVITNVYDALTSSVATVGVQPALTLALDNATLTWTTGGGDNGYGWFRQSDISHDGVDSAECAPPETFSPYSTAWLQTTVSGPATVDFYWKFYKSFASRSGDYLGLFLNGVYQAGAASPLQSFSHYDLYLGTGSHTVKWQYVRAGLVHGGGPGYVDEVTVTPGATPAFIATQPASQAAVAGSNATFSVVPSGTPPFTYQWRFNEVNLANATNGALLLTNVQPIQSGRYSVVVANGYGSPVASSNATLTVNTLPLPVAVDYAGPPWSTSGNTPWFGQVNQPCDGVDAAQSGWLTNSQQSTLSVRLVGPGNLSFWWKVSSETNYDFLRFYTNGVLKTNISGEVAWRKETFPLLSGTQTVSWTYAKDVSLSRGQDAAWVDQVTYDGRPCLSWSALSPEQSILYWPYSVTGYTLQLSTKLHPPGDWQSVTNPVTVVDDNWTVTNTSPTPQLFYRLKK